MATINTPTLAQLVQRIQNDFQTLIPNSNPFLTASWMKAFIISCAGRYFENYTTLNELILSIYPNTCSDDFVQQWMNIFSIPVIAATQSSGIVVATGTVGGTFSVGDLLQNSDGLQYQVTANTQIDSSSFSTTLARSGSTVTATTTSNHSFATGITVTIAGADQTEYNGDYVVTVTSDTTFTYTITGTPVTPATGTITSSADLAQIPVQSVDFGSDTNASSGTQLSFLAVSAADDGIAYVDFDGLTGGSDSATDEENREKVLFRFQNPVANFNVAAIEQQVFLVQNVKQVWVEPITPAPGQVTIYFTVTNTGNGIPTATQVTNVKNSILLIQPAEIDEADIIVSGPTPVSIDFDFSSLVPNTVTMQAAVTANLTDFLLNHSEVGEDVLELAYNSVIYNTIDLNTGQQVSSFTLTTPTGDVSISAGELAVPGDITYA